MDPWLISAFKQINSNSTGVSSTIPTPAQLPAALKSYVKLKEEFDGGNVQEQPDGNSSIVATIGKGEELEFLNEEKNGWVKVKLPSEVSGWKSKTIVTTIQH